MKTVKIDRFRLKDIVSKNLIKHRAAYEKAREAYRLSILEWFEEQTLAAERNKEFETYYNDEAAPEDHSAEYEDVLEMLEWTEQNQIELDQREFKNYVQDSWLWKGEFVANSSYYMTKVGMER